MKKQNSSWWQWPNVLVIIYILFITTAIFFLANTVAEYIGWFFGFILAICLSILLGWIAPKLLERYLNTDTKDSP